MKKELLIVYCDQLLRFSKINKEEVVNDDYVEARNEKEERRRQKEEEERQRQEEERERLEQEAREKAEAEGAAEGEAAE